MSYSDEEAKAAKAAAMYDLLSGYWQLSEKLNDALLATYERAVDKCSAEAVSLVCQRIASGQAGLNSSFPPTPADIAERAALLDAGNTRPVTLLNGLIEMDFGHGRVDMRGLDDVQQDAIIRGHGMIGNRNAALMSLDEKVEALKSSKSIAPPPKAERPALERKPWLELDGWVEWKQDWGISPPIFESAMVWVRIAGGGREGVPATGPRLYSEDSRPASTFAWDSRNAEIQIVAYKVDRRVQT